MSRLTIEITGEQHHQIKALAAIKGQSIKDYVIDKIFVSKEQEAWEELKEILNHRIVEAENGAISNQTFLQVAEDTLLELGQE